MPTPYLPQRIDPHKDINRKYLSIEDRIQIADLHRESHTPARIADMMDRHRSTITRELRRHHSADGPYRTDTAQLKALSKT
ncbi:helix-turn-helix domain-containing protein [Corynebacterium ulcerans]|uniref:helix-turn-helix domain-containing protein n=1 Tax=Corynebacterium ulcerans TaxID=65058 RepID=UPI0015E11B54|nr:helix-turn-helix domain-containing protein [Corynebacterium ulcerans]